MATPAPRWTRLEHDERREQILACARRLFSERHYAAVSSAEIATEAGVARGLLNHYFGNKRELYLEVVRSMVALPPQMLTEPDDGTSIEEILDAGVDRWLEAVKRNRETWFAAIGAGGFGDPEVESILERAREDGAEQLVKGLAATEGLTPSREARALARSYVGLAEATTWEWLVRKRVSRDQARALLTNSLLAMVRDVLPRVTDAGFNRPTLSKTTRQRTPA